MARRRSLNAFALGSGCPAAVWFSLSDAFSKPVANRPHNTTLLIPRHTSGTAWGIARFWPGLWETHRKIREEGQGIRPTREGHPPPEARVRMTAPVNLSTCEHL